MPDSIRRGGTGLGGALSESDEHAFLSGRTIDLLSDMSQAGLYGFKESDRKKFDFTCNLVRDWSRLISGQTLWKHSEGIEKDLRNPPG